MILNKLQTPEITIEIKEIHEHEFDYCEKICEKEDIIRPCHYRKSSVSNPEKPISNTRILFIISNLTSKEYYISDNDFTLVDSDGFSHQGFYLCDKYSAYDNALSNYHKISPISKIRFQVLFKGIDPNEKVSRISYKKSDSKELYHLYLDDSAIKDSEFLNNISLRKTIEELNLKIKEMKDYHAKSLDEIIDASIGYTNGDHLIQYTTKMDDDYFYIISNEENNTISFNREFDKSKSNFSWVNEGDALITMKLDNTSYHTSYPTKIESSVCGIFEFEKNKLIKFNEVICRIKLYNPNEKQEIIDRLEEDEIRKAVYKKEKKKRIEREALDDLIAQGLVFNSYITKEGNRSSIPMDVANTVWNRDGGRCINCGSNENLEFDHIIPVSKGGSNTYRNLQLLCETCNRKKSNKIG